MHHMQMNEFNHLSHINQVGQCYVNVMSLVEINQNVTISFATPCDLKSFATQFGNIYNYKIKFQIFWLLLQL
jgi:hypothetical protein